MNKNYFPTIALSSGGLLAMMIFLNGQLATYTSAITSSLIAHFVGIIGSWILWKLIVKSKKIVPYSSIAPKWFYLGGVGGALIVVIANITVNSVIGLVGSLSLMILGQTIFAIIFDITGLFGMKKRKLHFNKLIQISCILTGSILIILGGGK